MTNSSVVAALNSSQMQGTATSSATGSTSDNAVNKDTFLKLLVAQLKYQDPLKPTDPQSFMSQTAQFTQVEKLEELTAAITSSARTSSVMTGAGLLGRTVTFALPNGTTATGIVSSASPTADGVKLKVGNYETTLDQISDISVTPTA